MFKGCTESWMPSLHISGSYEIFSKVRGQLEIVSEDFYDNSGLPIRRKNFVDDSLQSSPFLKHEQLTERL